MTHETLTALKVSIAHHKANLEAKTPQEVKIGWRDCALCAAFLVRDGDGDAEGCGKCPIKIKTGDDFCINSPYDALTDALVNWKGSVEFEQFRQAFLAAERAEIEFLESLLPEGEK